jgi:hypothetical protein
MNGVPKWAQIVGAVLLGVFSSLGVFVTRWEHETTQADLRAIRMDINTIMWHMKGSESRDALVPADVPCSGEEDNPQVQGWLDALWERAKEIARADDARGRPYACFVPGPIFIIEDGTVKRLLGAYNRSSHRVVVGLAAAELNSHIRCVVLHEMLHALVGSDEGTVVRLMEGANELCQPRH